MTERSTVAPAGAAPAPVPPTAESRPARGPLGLFLLGLVWFAAVLWSARAGMRTATDPLSLIIDAALALPSVISASLLAGVAGGAGARGLLAGRSSRLPAWLPPAAVGLATGALAGGLVLAGYGYRQSIMVLAAAVLVAGVLGGALSALPAPDALAAGVAATLASFVVDVTLTIFQGPLADLFGAGGSAASRLTASTRVALFASVVSGLLAGVVAIGYLRRRSGRYLTYLLAGAAPGVLLLLAEMITRIGGGQLFRLAGRVSPADRQVLAMFGDARVEHALIVLFTGAVVALIGFGRRLGPASRSGARGGGR